MKPLKHFLHIELKSKYIFLKEEDIVYEKDQPAIPCQRTFDAPSAIFYEQPDMLNALVFLCATAT